MMQTFGSFEAAGSVQTGGVDWTGLRIASIMIVRLALAIQGGHNATEGRE
jgi:hypothetical protein